LFLLARFVYLVDVNPHSYGILLLAHSELFKQETTILSLTLRYWKSSVMPSSSKQECANASRGNKVMQQTLLPHEHESSDQQMISMASCQMVRSWVPILFNLCQSESTFDIPQNTISWNWTSALTKVNSPIRSISILRSFRQSIHSYRLVHRLYRNRSNLNHF
jgi:hypothetical protein